MKEREWDRANKYTNVHNLFECNAKAAATTTTINKIEWPYEYGYSLVRQFVRCHFIAAERHRNNSLWNRKEIVCSIDINAINLNTSSSSFMHAIEYSVSRTNIAASPYTDTAIVCLWIRAYRDTSRERERASTKDIVHYMNAQMHVRDSVCVCVCWCCCGDDVFVATVTVTDIAAILRSTFTLQSIVHSLTLVHLYALIRSVYLASFHAKQMRAYTHAHMVPLPSYRIISISWCLFLFWLSCHYSCAICVLLVTILFFFSPLLLRLSNISLSTNNVHSISHGTLSHAGWDFPSIWLEISSTVERKWMETPSHTHTRMGENDQEWLCGKSNVRLSNWIWCAEEYRHCMMNSITKPNDNNDCIFISQPRTFHTP